MTGRPECFLENLARSEPREKKLIAEYNYDILTNIYYRKLFQYLDLD